MASIQSALRAQLHHWRNAGAGAQRGSQDGYSSTAALVAQLNRQLFESTAAETFATFCYAVYDDAEGRLTYTNAGHLPPLVVGAGGVRRLDCGGIVLGPHSALRIPHCYTGPAVALHNRVAIVTGASRGIGKGIAVLLGRQGAAVAVTYRANRAGAEKTVQAIQSSGGRAFAISTDVTDPERTNQMVRAVAERFGRVDILVNNVGAFAWKTVADSTSEEWHDLLASNLDSVFYASRAVISWMRARRWGRIINLGAVGAERAFGQAKISAYMAAKAGMVAFSRSLALEEARNGITVNVVNPSIHDDPELTREEAARVRDTRFPIGRPPTAEDVAAAVLFFASEEAAYVTGQVVNVSGGWML